MSAEEQPVGATPLDPDEAEGLIPTHINTQAALNEWEQANILKARSWAFARKRKNLLTESFVRTLHLRMFDDTWNWAGKYRRSDKSIGVVAWFDVPARVEDACANARYWLDNSVFQLDELAVRLHHRLVQVHPFPNGNGRHARLMADLLLYYQGGPVLTWGSRNLQQPGDVRNNYLTALKQADRGDFGPLLRFARS